VSVSYEGTLHRSLSGGEEDTVGVRLDPRVTILALSALLCLFPGCGSPDSGRVADLLVTGGTLVDGTGSERQRADLTILDGRILEVAGEVRPARDTVDASGLVVAPGFIDVHNHTAEAIADPERRLNEGFVRQGVTTIVGGPDGGLAPSEMRQLWEAYEANGVGTNVALYVGHNAIRTEVMGDEQRRPPTGEELDRMKALVREGMELGALGFSTGLMYEPGMFSETREVVALAREVAPYDGIYDSHVRDPVHALLASDREAIEVAERAGIPAKIGHLKAVGLHNEGVIQDVIRLVEEARGRGLEVVSDQYPYDGAATGTLEEIIVVPPVLQEDPEFDLEIALNDAELRAAIRQTSENGIEGGFAWLKATGYSSMRITVSPDYPELVGRYLSEIARERGVDGFDLVAELFLGAREPVGITLGAIQEDDVRALMVQPWNMIASDGAYADGESTTGHPRSAGTFPRFLGRYVRDEGLLPLEEGVRKITHLPATFHGIGDRGLLAVGYPADLTIFDPERIVDRSTWQEPQRFAEGVVHVIVNGVPVLRDEEMTGEAPGEWVLGRTGARSAEARASL